MGSPSAAIIVRAAAQLGCKAGQEVTQEGLMLRLAEPVTGHQLLQAVQPMLHQPTSATTP